MTDNHLVSSAKNANKVNTSLDITAGNLGLTSQSEQTGAVAIVIYESREAEQFQIYFSNTRRSV